MDESLRVAFLRTLPIEDWERYQSELERKTDETWTRVALMESTWVLIWRYGTQSVMTVGLNQPIMREVIEKMMEFTEYDGRTDSVTDENAEESLFMGAQPNKRARKGLRKYNSMVRKLKNRVNDTVTNSKAVKSKVATLVMSLAKVSRPNEVGQGDSVMHEGTEKKNQVPPMLLAPMAPMGTDFHAFKSREEHEDLG